MGLGILETRQHAPGTVQLIEDHAESAGKENVVLVPHPSKSPNDPLVGLCSSLRGRVKLMSTAVVELANMEKRSDTVQHSLCYRIGIHSGYSFSHASMRNNVGH